MKPVLGLRRSPWVEALQIFSHTGARSRLFPEVHMDLLNNNSKIVYRRSSQAMDA